MSQMLQDGRVQLASPQLRYQEGHSMNRPQPAGSAIHRVHNPNHPPRQGLPPPNHTAVPPSELPIQQPAFDPFQGRDPFMGLSQAGRRGRDEPSASVFSRYRDMDLSSSASRAFQNDVHHLVSLCESSPYADPSLAARRNERRLPTASSSTTPALSASSSPSYHPALKNDHARPKATEGDKFPATPLPTTLPPPPPPSQLLPNPQPLSPKCDPASSYSQPAAKSPLPITFDVVHKIAASSRHRPSTSMSIQSIMSSEIPKTNTFSQWTSSGARDTSGLVSTQTPKKRLENQSLGSSEASIGTFSTAIALPACNRSSPEQDSENMACLPQSLFVVDPVAVPVRPFSQPAVSSLALGDGSGQRNLLVRGLDLGENVSEESKPISTQEMSALRHRAFSDLAHGRGVGHDPLRRPLPYSVIAGSSEREGKTPNQHCRPWPTQTGNDGLPDLALQRTPSSDQGSDSNLLSRDNSSVHHVSSLTPRLQTVVPRSVGRSEPPPPLSTSHDDGVKPYHLSTVGSGFISKNISGSDLLDKQVRASREDLQQHNSLLSAMNHEGLRKTERASPLPQAVQGASGQPPDSNRDPIIKSEFARMFSGLGSGVGSTPQPPTSQEGDSQSPIIEEEADHEVGARLNDRASIQIPSRAEARGKRRLEDDSRAEDGNGEGMLTTAIPSKAGKKSKTHHHHRLNPSHHHHYPHRYHQFDDEISAFAGQGSSSTSLRGLAFPVTAKVGTLHHHHHHLPTSRHHHHHYRHHYSSKAPFAQQSALILPLSRSKNRVDSRSLLGNNYPSACVHLGSYIYAQHVDVSPAIAAITQSEQSIAMITQALNLPVLTRKQYCTVTIRIPRFYLAELCRETICAERRIWGTDVYTDDSDPIAAAIHAGWIMGAWPEEVPIKMLELASSSEGGTGISNESPERVPMMPPKDKDLHLTLLVLPALEAYASSVRYGVKSRAWASNHDGMSFRIERIEWIDEGAGGRCEVRSGRAKKGRLKDWMRVTRTRTGKVLPEDKNVSSGGMKNNAAMRLAKVHA